MTKYSGSHSTPRSIEEYTAWESPASMLLYILKEEKEDFLKIFSSALFPVEINYLWSFKLEVN